MLKHSKFVRFIPMIMILIMIAVVYFTKLYRFFSIEWIKSEHVFLKTYVDTHPFLSPLIFMAIYIVSVVLIIPDSTLLTLLAGYFFSFPLAVIYTLLSETIGGYLFFLALTGVVPTVKKAFLKKMSEKFRLHSASYLLFLRLSHLLPFWLINSFAAYFKIKPWTFIWTTFIGLIPLTFVLVEAGHDLSKIFKSGKPFTLSAIFTPETEITLVLMGLLALLPLAYRAWKKKK